MSTVLFCSWPASLFSAKSQLVVSQIVPCSDLTDRDILLSCWNRAPQILLSIVQQKCTSSFSNGTWLVSKSPRAFRFRKLHGRKTYWGQRPNASSELALPWVSCWGCWTNGECTMSGTSATKPWDATNYLHNRTNSGQIWQSWSPSKCSSDR